MVDQTKAKEVFVNFVNPKLGFFNRPLLLACLVGIFTLAGFLVTFMMMVSNATVTLETDISEGNPNAYVWRNTAGSVSYCLGAAILFEPTGKKIELQSYCMPREEVFTLEENAEYFNKEKYPELEGYYSNPQPLQWCPDLAELGGYVPTANEKWAYGKDMCEHKGPWEKSTDIRCPECPKYGAMTWYLYRTEYPDPGTTLGAALGYAAYIEVVLTTIIVGTLLLCRIVKNTRPDFSLLSVSMEEMTKASNDLSDVQKELAAVKSALMEAGIKVREESVEDQNKAAKKASVGVAAEIVGIGAGQVS